MPLPAELSPCGFGLTGHPPQLIMAYDPSHSVSQIADHTHVQRTQAKEPLWSSDYDLLRSGDPDELSGLRTPQFPVMGSCWDLHYTVLAKIS